MTPGSSSDRIHVLHQIVHKVASASSASAAVNLIVDEICATLAVQVCNLYGLDSNKNAVLVACHGLQPSAEVAFSVNKGLIGHVIRNCVTLNIDDAPAHPDFLEVPEIREKHLHSFCGVPLVRNGIVIGALAVQSSSATAFSGDDEAFLFTLACQLALLIPELEQLPQGKVRKNICIHGLKGAPGIGIGIPYFCDQLQLSSAPDGVCDDLEAGIAQWQKIRAATALAIENDQKKLRGQVGDDINSVFEAYKLLLQDQALNSKVELELSAGHWLPKALQLSISYFADLFRQMPDSYLQQRAEDILFLGNKLYEHLLGNQNQQASAGQWTEPVILVGRHVSVSDIATVPTQFLAGIISFEGSSLSHTAILASALGIPAIVGFATVPEIPAEERLIIDADHGQVIVHADATMHTEYKQLFDLQQAHQSELMQYRDLPARTVDGESINLFVNTGLLADISPGVKYGADGVGLYRTEIPFMVRDSFPSEKEQIEEYRKVFSAYTGKPIFMRTLDIGGDKPLPYFPIDNESNPVLGWRGIRFSLDNMQLMVTQLRAMIIASENSNNLHITLPMVISTGELDAFHHILRTVSGQLESEKIQFQKPKVGIMIETPAAISQLAFWRKKIDFASIGSNDLSQYVLAIDRNNTRVAARYDPVHPAIVHELIRITTISRSIDLPLSVCGELASDDTALPLLLGMGVRQFSVSAAKLLHTKQLIRSVNTKKLEMLVDSASRLDSADAIRALVGKFMESNIPDHS